MIRDIKAFAFNFAYVDAEDEVKEKRNQKIFKKEKKKKNR